MKTNNYIILVDSHKKLRSLYRQNLAGRYRVGANTEEEALQIIKVYLGKFGNPRIYYKCREKDIIAKNGEIIVEHRRSGLAIGTELFQSGDERIIKNVKYLKDKDEKGNYIYL